MLESVRTTQPLEEMMKKRASIATTRRKKTPRANRSKAQEDKIAATVAAINKITPPNPEAARAIALLKSWLADESGYDEQTWPKLKQALDRERDRVGARRLFDG